MTMKTKKMIKNDDQFEQKINQSNKGSQSQYRKFEKLPLFIS